MATWVVTTGGLLFITTTYYIYSISREVSSDKVVTNSNISNLLYAVIADTM